MTATANLHGGFDVRNGDGLIVAVISRTNTFDGRTFWRVYSRTTGRKNSRSRSDTPEQAAKKYFSRKVEFIYARPL